jgi:hypothetical protein
LYEAGMDIVENLREAMLGDYVEFADFGNEASGGVIECIPKLTQALLVPLETVRERRGTVDDYLFPLLFDKEGPYRSVLDRTAYRSPAPSSWSCSATDHSLRERRNPSPPLL